MIQKYIKCFSISLLLGLSGSFALGMEEQASSNPQGEIKYMPSLLRITTLASLKKWNKETLQEVLKQRQILTSECKELLINETMNQLQLADLHEAPPANIPELFAMGADFERCTKTGENHLLWYLQKNCGEKAVALLEASLALKSLKFNVNHRNIYGAGALDLVEKVQSKELRDTIKALLYEKGVPGYFKGVLTSGFAQAKGFLSAVISKDDKEANKRAASKKVVEIGEHLAVGEYQNYVQALPVNTKQGLPAFINEALNPEGMTRLHYAATKQEVEKLFILGADINIKTRHEETPLHTMLQRGDCEAALRLIKNISPGSGYCNASDAYQMKPLCYAVLAGDSRLVRQLIIKGADPEYGHVVERGANMLLSPVVFLASTENEKILNSVLGKSSIIVKELHYKIRLEAMARAIENDNDPLFNKLVMEPETINIYLSNDDYSNVLSYLLYKRRGVGLANLLTDPKYLQHLNADSKSSNGVTPLMVAARSSAGDISQCWFKRVSWPETIKRLILLGGSVNASDNKGSTPLHYAAESGSLAVVKELLDHGASINSKDNNGNTPLHCAVINEQEDVVNFLVDKADLSVRNNDRRRPCDIITEQGEMNDYAHITAPDDDRSVEAHLTTLAKKLFGYNTEQKK